MGSDETVLIVGASHAGVACAEALRKFGFEGVIRLIDRAPHLPVERPPLSKAVLGTADTVPQKFPLRKREWYGDLALDLITGAEITQIDGEAKTAHSSANNGDGRVFGWDRLVLATGAVPRVLPIEGGDLPCVLPLRTAEDARRLAEVFDKANQLVLIGGGYIGLEVAASARKRGLEVTVLEAAPRLLARVASVEASAFFHHLHSDNGVKIITDVVIEAILEEGEGCSIKTSVGAIAADVVVVGIGVTPETGLGDGLGAKIGNGFVTDSNYQIIINGIATGGFAIGDVALPDDGYTGGAIRIESVHHAQMSAEIAAAAMLGLPPKPHEVPWFWSEQYASRLQSAGIVPANPYTVTRAGRKPESQSFWSFADGVLKAVEAINDPGAYMIGRMILADNRPITPEIVANPDFNLKTLIQK